MRCFVVRDVNDKTPHTNIISIFDPPALRSMPHGLEPFYETCTPRRQTAKYSRACAQHLQLLPRDSRTPPHARRPPQRRHGRYSTRTLTLRASRTTLAERRAVCAVGVLGVRGRLTLTLARSYSMRAPLPSSILPQEARAVSTIMHDMVARHLATPFQYSCSQLATPPVGSCCIGRTIRPDSYNDGIPAVVGIQSGRRREPIRAAGRERKSRGTENCYITVGY